jgi:hypothetical protein
VFDSTLIKFELLNSEEDRDFSKLYSLSKPNLFISITKSELSRGYSIADSA